MLMERISEWAEVRFVSKLSIWFLGLSVGGKSVYLESYGNLAERFKSLYSVGPTLIIMNLMAFFSGTIDFEARLALSKLMMFYLPSVKEYQNSYWTRLGYIFNCRIFMKLILCCSYALRDVLSSWCSLLLMTWWISLWLRFLTYS